MEASSLRGGGLERRPVGAFSPGSVLGVGWGGPNAIRDKLLRMHTIMLEQAEAAFGSAK